MVRSPGSDGGGLLPARASRPYPGRPGPHLPQEVGRIDCVAQGLAHDKCYAPTLLTSYPPKRPWICRRTDCLRIGIDVERVLPVTSIEYRRLQELRRARDEAAASSPEAHAV